MFQEKGVDVRRLLDELGGRLAHAVTGASLDPLEQGLLGAATGLMLDLGGELVGVHRHDTVVGLGRHDQQRWVLDARLDVVER